KAAYAVCTLGSRHSWSAARLHQLSERRLRVQAERIFARIQDGGRTQRFFQRRTFLKQPLTQRSDARLELLVDFADRLPAATRVLGRFRRVDPLLLFGEAFRSLPVHSTSGRELVHE